MKKLMVIGCLLLVFGGLSAQNRNIEPMSSDLAASLFRFEPKISTGETSGVTVMSLGSPVFITGTTIGNSILKDSIPFNNTNVKIFLDSLVSGTAIDTTIKKNRTITKYSFTPSVNRWNVTDSSYNARYFLTIDVFQVVTNTPDKVIQKQVAELDAEIEIDQKRIQDKIRARDAARALKSKN